MFESDVKLKLADCPKQVAAIVRETIQKIYPHYYPSGAVLFFFNQHSEVEIKERMSSEEIYLAMVRGNMIGTGSIRRNEICRLFILPEYQGKGYGSRLMDLLEARIFENYSKVHIDASFPAESMYLKRGYQIVSYEKIETENGDFLCYHTMEKERGGNLSV
ncbi:MAG: GNAT family N-acetyltransferase [Lachnospiraceae bacterium]|nr:GNAT family N-acetyltransferase [Lachnospiraceae bacterium]